MRKLTKLIPLLLLLGACASQERPGSASKPNPAAQDLERWVVVMTDPRPARRRGWVSGVGYAGSTRYDEDPALARMAGRLEKVHGLRVLDQWPVSALRVHCLVVALPVDDAATLAALQAYPGVEWVQPLNEFESQESLEAAGNASYESLQQSLTLLNLEPATMALSGRGVIVAIVDSGVEADHPDIAPALAANFNMVGPGASPAERHGTGIAGVVAAASDNNLGITGVAPGARIQAFRSCWEGEQGPARCNSLTLSRALDKLTQAPPNVLNLSLTGPRDRLLEELLDRLLEAGTYVVTAYDPQREPQQRFPRARDGVFVAASGSEVSAATRHAYPAPGHTVLTAQPGHSYDFMSGHSIAAAHLAGVLALMLEANPQLAYGNAAELLEQSIRQSGTTLSVDACTAVRSLEGTACGGASAQQTVKTQP